MGVFDDLIDSLRAAVSALDTSALSGAQAARLVKVLSEGERLFQAGRTLAASRVLETGAWRKEGSHRTAAMWMAARTRGTLSAAIGAVQTASRLAGLPATRAALIAGDLSDVQATEITAAASADPSAEQTLLQMASSETVHTLKQRCAEVISAASSDEERCERIRRGRYLRRWTDHEGAFRLDARLTPDDGAVVWSVIGARADQLQTTARASGQFEPVEAFAADALIELATGTRGPRASVTVHVDRAALKRGHTVAGERCSIKGAGPVPVATATRLLGDAVVSALAMEGADVLAVVGLGRTIPARLRTALDARDPACVVPGCDIAEHLEIDHVVPLAHGGRTILENLARLCRWHHAQKTFHGWRLGGCPGEWTWRRGARTSGRWPPARAP